jgi:hypothetical protein
MTIENGLVLAEDLYPRIGQVPLPAGPVKPGIIEVAIALLTSPSSARTVDPVLATAAETLHTVPSTNSRVRLPMRTT